MSEPPVRILVVDDTAAKRFATRAALLPLGYEIVEADSGVAALRCVLADDFAVILLDVGMPGMDGFETAGLIRQRKQSEITPIIFITAHSGDEIMQKDRFADGAVDFMFAPVPPAELRAKVSAFGKLFTNAELLASQARKVQAARDLAVSANEMQKTFVASASHELRTPTTSILGYVEVLLDSNELSEQDRGFLEITQRNAQRLSQLIDDLLIVGQADIGPSMMHLEPTALLPLVERVTAAFSSAAERAGITLATACEPKVALALVDPDRLEQVLTNLIGNAVKFTPTGGAITMDIRTRGDTVELSVADNGIGIDPADLANIFGRFYRSKAATDSEVKGSGLGLAIAKGMVEAQGGHIVATSTLGHGSTFTLTLPAAIHEMRAA